MDPQELMGILPRKRFLAAQVVLEGMAAMEALLATVVQEVLEALAGTVVMSRRAQMLLGSGWLIHPMLTFIQCVFLTSQLFLLDSAEMVVLVERAAMAVLVVMH